MKELTLEEKIERVRNLRPIDDAFFEVLAQNREVCEEILRTILGDPNLSVIDVVPQSSQKNLYGRSARLDALCILGDGTKCNIEVQRSDYDDHLRRARFNASLITVRDSNPGNNFEKVEEVYVIYISEFDIFKEGKTIYHIEKVIRETGTIVNDGLHEIFVNTAVDDKSDIAELMSCFIKKEVNNPKFPKLSGEVTKLKANEGGTSTVSSVIDTYFKEEIAEARVEARAEGLAEGLAEGRTQGIAEGRTQGIAEGRTQGIAEGRTQGIAEGLAQGRAEMAKSLKQNGISLEIIAEASGLTIEQIDGL